MSPEQFNFSLKHALNERSMSMALMDVINVIYDARFPQDMQFIGEATIGDFTKVKNLHNSTPVLQLVGLVLAERVIWEHAKAIGFVPQNSTDRITDPTAIAYGQLTVQKAIAIVRQLAPKKWGTDPCDISTPDLVALGDKVGFMLAPDPAQ